MKPILVVKVGTSSLLDAHERPSGAFDEIAQSIKRLTEHYRVVLVTSGAIGFGVRHAVIAERPSDVACLQALSMLGQVGLMERWNSAFGDWLVGQVLVTRHDLKDKAESALFERSVEALWEYGAVPVVNENDAVATEEISFGDNDRLAAEIAVRLKADKLVLLTDQDGIQADFGTDAQRRLEQIAIDAARLHITTATSGVGRGGANSKLEAAAIALRAGIQPYIARASDQEAIERVIAGQTGTKIVQ